MDDSVWVARSWLERTLLGELEINPVISRDVMEKLERSTILDVSLIRNNVPRDIADQVLDDYEKVMERRTFKPKVGVAPPLPN